VIMGRARKKALRRRVPQQERSRATRDALLEAIHIVVSNHGVDGVTVRRVADRAGAALGSVYQYFATREALIAAWEVRELERLGARMSEVVAQLFVELPPLEESVRRVTLVGIDGIAEMMRHYRSSAALFSSLRERLQIVTPIAEAVAAALERAPNRARVRPSHLVIALRVAIVAVAYGAGSMAKLDLSQAERAVWRESVADMIVAFLVKDPAP
jgi:AcrR family transcriptional regulator